MTVGTLLKYLVGRREAILSAAQCRGAIWIGLLFVVAAGFAREYDGEDLLHEPWHLFIPLLASVASSAALYLMVRGIALLSGERRPTFLGGFRQFLTLYWLTAPLALFYAIPVERFLSAGGAMEANLWLLALVAAWRVVLMSRVISVVYTTSFAAALFVVMLFADTLLLIVLYFTPVPIFQVMGGIRLSQSEQVLQMTTLFVKAGAIVSWPVWFFGMFVVAFWNAAPWRFAVPDFAASDRAQPDYVNRSLAMTAAASIVVWLLLLPLTQPPQILRHRVERDLYGGRFREALATMSAHEPGDFPPHWDPPPRIAFRQARPDVVSVQECVAQMELKPWVRDLFTEKFINSIGGRSTYWSVWKALAPEEIERRLAILERLSLDAETLEVLAFGIRPLEEDAELPESTREAVTRYLSEFDPKGAP